MIFRPISKYRNNLKTRSFGLYNDVLYWFQSFYDKIELKFEIRKFDEKLKGLTQGFWRFLDQSQTLEIT